MEKKCSRCGRILDASAFYRSVATPDRLDVWCKKCRKADTKRYNTENYKLGFKLGIRNTKLK